MEQKNKAPVNWILRAAGVLLCLVLASTYLVCGLFARYTTSASGSDSARVAKFEVEGGSVSSAMITASLVPGNTHECSLQIRNKSEVAVEYEVTVENITNNLPLTYDVPGMGMENGSFVATLEPNGASMTYKLKIQWPEDHASPDYAGMVDRLRVTVNATQID